MRIAIVGLGRMGQAVESVARSRGHEIAARIGRAEGGEHITRERLAGADVAIEFTRPEAAPGSLQRLVDLDVPVVTGTTGWTEHLPALSERVAARQGALLYASNFSIGLQLMLRAARSLATQFRGQTDFGAAILETHHAAKRDAPSGTALMLQHALQAADPGRGFPTTSVRVGHVPGIHQVLYDGLFETVELTHTVRDRAVFALGAVTAAEWLAGRRGVYTFSQMLFGEDA